MLTRSWLNCGLCKQESTRLRAQVEHLSSSLEETRKTLSEERERAVEAAASEAQQAQLLERINQLNILRESNATLRADCESHAKKARALETKLQQLTSELEPTKEQLRVARAELEARDGQVKRLEDEARKWQERNTQLLTKYDRIDPAEVQALKDQIAQLSSTNAELEQSTSSRQSTDAQKIAELEAKVNEMRGAIRKNNEISKGRFERDRIDKERLAEQVKELEQQLQTIIAERDELKSRTTDSSQTGELSKQLQALRDEKVDLERRLQEAQSAHTAAPSAETEASLAQITQERDALLAEKATWSASGAPEGAQQWETEKAQLVKARDDALAHVKRNAERVQTLANELKEIRLNHAKLITQLQEVEKERAAEKERFAAEQQAAVDVAVNKIKSESQTTASTPESIAQHAQELRALEERLKKQHQEELKSAVEAAKTVATNGALPADTKAVIDAAIAAKEEEMKATREQEIQQAIERGRMEAGARAKLKDSQIVRAQSRVKELEAQIEELKKQGVTIPPPPASVSGAKLGPSPSTSNLRTSTAGAGAAKPPPHPPAVQHQPHPVPTAPAAQHRPPHAAGKPAGPASLPQKPGGAVGHHVVPGVGRGRGRGRGVAAAAGLSIRGASAGPATIASGSSPTESVSIVGAAGKRPREEGETSGDDSLAKRLKPEGASKPVPIQRNRVHTPSAGS
ncbi:hypothetical protein NM688_g7928 [Phlebia brevispora]|uniref:Uncharacterized protein n=1 Tax=Phlebia brevispora TaxID=194682 RepID=A0ACC1RZI8_9APHY|nr:hypothetical protein NM688_g7928 [Phlebia brevispora]